MLLLQISLSKHQLHSNPGPSAQATKHNENTKETSSRHTLESRPWSQLGLNVEFLAFQ